jgi:Flp pilus assembly protein TadD
MDRSPGCHRWIAPLLLIAVALAANAIIVRNGFILWDDQDTIQHNFRLWPPTLTGLTACWTQPQGALWVPVTYTAWWGICAACSLFTHALEPPAWPFHLVSLLAHVAACLVLLALLVRLVGDIWSALLGAMVFAAHPLQVEAIAWASGLKDVLCGLLVLAALRSYLASGDCAAAQDRKGRLRWWALATAFFVLGMLAKPTAVVTPLLALAVDRVALRRSWRATLAWLAPWLALSLALTAVVAPIQWSSLHTETGPAIGLRCFVAADALCFYLHKLIVPWPLGLIYGRPPEVVLTEGSGPIQCVILLVIALLGGWLLQGRPLLRRRAVAAAVLFVGGLLPVLGFVPFSYQWASTVADHYMYLPMAGVALLVAAIAAQVRAPAPHAPASPQPNSPSIKPPHRMACILAGGVVAAMIILSFTQAATWRNSVSLFRQALLADPTNWLAFNHLALSELDNGDIDGALALAQKAAKFGPDHAWPQVTLGIIWARVHEDVQAEQAFHRAIELDPRDANARVNFGWFLSKRDRRGEAAEQWLAAVHLDPQNPLAHLNLGILLAKSGVLDRAAIELEAAERLAPGDYHTHANLGALYMQKGQREQAIAELRTALHLEPDDATSRAALKALGVNP